jgi:hypothetical protein
MADHIQSASSMGALLIPELLYIPADIKVHMLMPLHTHSISFNYIYHTIYTIFENALIALCIWYQNFGEPSLPVPIWYHKVVIPAQHRYQHDLCI